LNSKFYAARAKLSGLLVTLPLLFILSGCHMDHGATKSSQVVATVNNHEITTSQLNQALEAAGVDQVTPAEEKEAIDSLVAEELLVQDALKSKLDRQPAVVLAMERARRQVLAQAYAERSLYSPTALEIEE
jgi:peptidyl-prolyl cis-trans isomerase C